MIAIQNGARGTLALKILTVADGWKVAPWTITGEEPTETVRQKWLEYGFLYYQQLAIRMNGGGE